MRLNTKALSGGGSGKSAYELAVDEGFEGTLEEWLEHLKGKDGDDGDSAPTITKAKITLDKNGSITGLELLMSDSTTITSEIEIEPEVTVEEETVEEDIVPFTTVRNDTDRLPIGEEEVVQEGKDGYTSVRYEVTYEDGVEVDRKEVSRDVVAPVDEIIEVGIMEPEIPVDTVTVSPKSVQLEVGDTQQINSEVLPANATNKVVNYTSDDESIATVDGEGLVTALAAGGVNIVAESYYDGSKIDTCVVSVTEPEPEEPEE